MLLATFAKAPQLRQQLRVAHNQPGRDILDHARGKAGCARGIQRYGDDAAQQAAEEDADPLGGVLAPQHHAVAGNDAAPIQLRGKTPRNLCELAVGRRVAAIAAMRDYGSLRRVLTELLDESGQVRPHGSHHSRVEPDAVRDEDTRYEE